MKKRVTIVALALSLAAWGAMAQDTPLAQKKRSQAEMQKGHQPPPQAFEDCRGKKTGDTVQHTTPEGVVAATCLDSPQGLVARPKQPKGAPAGSRTAPDTSSQGTPTR
jgi:hypothetical protein